MGNPFSIPCDPCTKRVFDWLDEKGSYTRNLKKNLVALDETMEELKARRDDLSRRVKIEEDKGLERLAQFQVWLDRVTNIEKEVVEILRVKDVELHRLCLCGFCSKSLISSYRYGKRVFMAARKVEKLKDSVFDELVGQPTIVEVSERPLQPIIVGQETMLKEAWNHLIKDEVGIMGLYGMGGVGKTTLLTQLNNKLSKERCGFDFVIWVVVSQELHVEKIIDEIAQEVGLGGGGWNGKDESQKVVHLFNFLKNKRFVLFLDDMWEEVDLAKIGVPFPTPLNGCKVAFTTRSKDVCGRMRVQDSMEVQCLTEKDAFDLFKYNVGERTLGSHPEIPDLAQQIVEECCGLPLALDVIGRTMSCKSTVQEWHDALDVLKSYACEFPDMNNKILPLLKYSYDNLDDKVKSCLLYCALFPEDNEIPKNKLIDYWICEGNIVDESEGIQRAENKGYAIIGSLICASLLMEAGIDEVRMHDVVREMAIWIATDLGKEKEAFIVHAGVGLKKMPNVKNWNVVRRMSLMRNKIGYLVCSPECRELTIFLMQGAKLNKISSEFFKSMTKLVVLDLSDNPSLSELPDGISELVSLQYLNLLNTGIKELPKGLVELKKLIHLDLGGTTSLKSIAGISSLHNLKVLKLCSSGISLDLSTVEELETLKQLEILTTGISFAPCVEKFLSSYRLTRCTQALFIRFVDLESSGITIPSNMGNLRKFVVYGCGKISEICINNKTVSPLHQCFLSLSHVSIIGCRGLKELTLLMFAPNLTKLFVQEARGLEDIIKKEKACEDGALGIVPFPKLISLKLECLRKLKNIYWSPLPFPCLEEIDVSKCRNLKKLPLDSKSGKQGANGLFIKYSEGEWIEGLEWEDEATKTRFLSSCQFFW